MNKSTFSGGAEVKASTLQVGDTIRNPKNKEMIMIVEETGNQIYIRGYEQDNTKYHKFLDSNQMVIKVTQADTDTTKNGVA